MTLTHNKIECPNCSHEINVENILYEQIEKESQKIYSAKLSEQNNIFTKKLEDLESEKAKLEEEKSKISKIVKQQLEDQLKEETKKLEQEIKVKLQQEQSEYLKDLEEEIKEKSSELKSFHKAKAEISRLKREKDELKERVEAEAEERLTEILKQKTQEIQKGEQNKHELKLSEKEEIIDNLKTKIKELQLKSEQGSVQLQGEVQELAIERWLKNEFIYDDIQEVLKGVSGADCLQIVNTREKLNCGKIYYESKRTKTFDKKWIEKFKEDIRKSGVDVGVIVSGVGNVIIIIQ